MTTNKNEANKATVLAALEAVRTTLRNEPASPSVTAALAQCDRLELAISQFHAEGLRFAAFTLLRMVRSSGSDLPEAVHSATHSLKSALESAGYPH
ncbi:MAG TPA: hypothetical protein VJM31_06025 [Vicinamibacterales bacterium]|nr:hypothetical protein [Vicinamibacterales bacterium]